MWVNCAFLLCQRLQTALSCSYFNKMYSIYNDTSFELAWPLAKLSAPHQPRRGAQRVHSDNRFIHWNSKPRKIRQKARLTYFFDDFICVRQGFGSVWCLSNYHHLFFYIISFKYFYLKSVNDGRARMRKISWWIWSKIITIIFVGSE